MGGIAGETVGHETAAEQTGGPLTVEDASSLTLGAARHIRAGNAHGHVVTAELAGSGKEIAKGAAGKAKSAQPGFLDAVEPISLD
jgi:hypothetical protein